jgi:hypothetical protein
LILLLLLLLLLVFTMLDTVALGVCTISHSPELSPYDFLKMQNICKRFTEDPDVKQTAFSWLNTLYTSLFHASTQALLSR